MGTQHTEISCQEHSLCAVGGRIYLMLQNFTLFWTPRSLSNLSWPLRPHKIGPHGGCRDNAFI